MKTAESTNRSLGGIAALFDDAERKVLFKKYLYLLGWIELLILVICWLYQVGDSAQNRLGSTEESFPWRIYFVVAFLAPVAITFLVGMVVVGFNKYFGAAKDAVPDVSGEVPHEADDKSGRIYKLNRMVNLLRQLPFLALLLLLGVAVGFFYKLDVIMSFIGSVGEKSVRIFLISAAILLALLSVFALILIVLNFQLRKRSMEYQYRSEVAERFGLIILDDNTVLNSEGKLLINGKKWKESVPLLTSEPAGAAGRDAEAAGPATRPIDCETT